MPVHSLALPQYIHRKVQTLCPQWYPGHHPVMKLAEDANEFGWAAKLDKHLPQTLDLLKYAQGLKLFR